MAYSAYISLFGGEGIPLERFIGIFGDISAVLIAIAESDLCRCVPLFGGLAVQLD
jgi:hypothetical protein